jgi:NhaP-type Na+/H+ or K+/H+ antiporter
MTLFAYLPMAVFALLAWAFAHLLGGSPFIAAFVGGLASAAIGRGLGEKVVEFTEAEGEILNYLVFFLVGIFAFSVLAGTGWTAVLYAVLSLTLIRMLPVALSLIGSGLSGTTVLFVGWFGPRGLASIVLVLIALAEDRPYRAGMPKRDVISVLTAMGSRGKLDPIVVETLRSHYDEIIGPTFAVQRTACERYEHSFMGEAAE